MRLKKWVSKRWNCFLKKNCLPSDLKERMRVKAFLLGSGCPPSTDMKTEVEFDDEKA